MKKNKILLFCAVITLPIQIKAQSLDYPAPGELVDMGGYKMHLLVEGKDMSGPTVIFFHGAGDIALHWNLVLPEVGKFATSIAFDQAGEGWSEHGHGVALNQQVYDSHVALIKGGFKPPYVVVGHSLGGILANLFAVAYKSEVAGVVMVDATHPDVVLKIFNKELGKLEWKKMRLTADQEIPEVNKNPLSEPLEISSFQPQRDFGNLLNKFSIEDRKLFHWIYNERPWTYVKGQGNSYEAEIFQDMFENPDKYLLGNIPLVVITGTKKDPPTGDENWITEELVNHSKALQKSLLNLSANSRQVFAAESGHHVQIDQPELVVEEIQKILEKTGENKK